MIYGSTSCVTAISQDDEDARSVFACEIAAEEWDCAWESVMERVDARCGFHRAREEIRELVYMSYRRMTLPEIHS
jgi:hypothetical protein